MDGTGGDFGLDFEDFAEAVLGLSFVGALGDEDRFRLPAPDGVAFGGFGDDGEPIAIEQAGGGLEGLSLVGAETGEAIVFADHGDRGHGFGFVGDGDEAGVVAGAIGEDREGEDFERE